jgi:hypothetical protein
MFKFYRRKITFSIVYKDCEPLEIEFNNTPLADQYQQLIQDTYKNDTHVICRDQKYYTLEVLQKLAIEASQAFNWNWNTSDLSIDNLTLMHKDIENLVGNGYKNLPEEYDELVHNIHYGLHAIEAKNDRGSWLQVEWFNDVGFTIPPEDYPGKIGCEFGDIKLQNPWVGHNPLFVYGQNDFRDVEKTCKFHDFCKPGINILITDYNAVKNYNQEEYQDWFNTHAPSFVQKHTWETILAYTGDPVVGRVTNLHVLEDMLEQPHLIFKEFIF